GVRQRGFGFGRPRGARLWRDDGPGDGGRLALGVRGLRATQTTPPPQRRDRRPEKKPEGATTTPAAASPPDSRHAHGCDEVVCSAWARLGWSRLLPHLRRESDAE